MITQRNISNNIEY